MGWTVVQEEINKIIELIKDFKAKKKEEKNKLVNQLHQIVTDKEKYPLNVRWEVFLECDLGYTKNIDAIESLRYPISSFSTVEDLVLSNFDIYCGTNMFKIEEIFNILESELKETKKISEDNKLKILEDFKEEVMDNMIVTIDTSF